MNFCKSVIMVGLSLGLASCSGGSGQSGGEQGGRGEQGASVPSLVDNATSLEMTDAIVSGSRTRIGCSGTVCESSPGAEDYSLASRHAEWLLARSDTGRAENTRRSETGSETYRRTRRLGRYSGLYSIGFFGADGSYGGGWSAALGSSESRPLGSATWTGSMAGFETRNGIELEGTSTVTYSVADNTVEVRVSGISGSGYRGEPEYYWQDVPVGDDGSFLDRGQAGMYMNGNFYGPNAEETVGVFEFELDFISGGWFADK